MNRYNAQHGISDWFPTNDKCCPLKSETSKKPHCVMLCRNQWPTRPFCAYQILSLPFEHLINHLIMNSELFEKQMSYLMNFYYIEFFSNSKRLCQKYKATAKFQRIVLAAGGSVKCSLDLSCESYHKTWSISAKFDPTSFDE